MRSARIKPMGDRVLIRCHEETEQVLGGVLIPDRAKEKQQEATVIAVGPGRRTEEGILIPMETSVGDTVLVSGYGGDEVSVDEIVYTLVREDDILGILINSPVAATV